LSKRAASNDRSTDCTILEMAIAKSELPKIAPREHFCRSTQKPCIFDVSIPSESKMLAPTGGARASLREHFD